MFLRKNGYRIKPRWKEASDFVVAIVSRERDWKEVAHWLESKSKPIT
jgi:prophage maintenance system killer protein